MTSRTLQELLHRFIRRVWRRTVQFLSLPNLLSVIRFTGARRKDTQAPLPFSKNHACLTNSLMDIYQLQKHGKDARLAIGVKKEEGKLSAHAWVEKEGENFDEQNGFKKIGTL